MAQTAQPMTLVLGIPSQWGRWKATLRMREDLPIVSLEFGYESYVEYLFVLDTAANDEWALYHDDAVGTLCVSAVDKIDDETFVIHDHMAVVHTARAFRQREIATA